MMPPWSQDDCSRVCYRAVDDPLFQELVCILDNDMITDEYKAEVISSSACRKYSPQQTDHGGNQP